MASKIYTLLSCLTYIVFITAAKMPMTPEMKAAIDNCKSAYPVNREDIKTLHMTGKLKNENDENSQCHVECMMKSIGSIVDADGKFDVEKSKANLFKHPVFFGPPGSFAFPTQEKIDSVVEACKSTEAGETVGKCAVNYKIWACIYAKFHE